MSQHKLSRGGQSQASIWERIAWYALLAVPFLVPVAVSKVLFSSAPPLTYNMFVYPKLLVLGCLVAVSLLAWCVGVVLEAVETRTVPLWWLLLIFFALAALSTVFGLNPMTGFFGGDYFAVGLLIFLLGGALYFLITQLVSSVARMRAFSWSAVAGGLCVAVVGLMQMLGIDPLNSIDLPGFMTARGASLIGNPDFTGTYLVLPAVLAAALALSESTKARRIGAGISFVAIAAALVGTLTRGAWLGAALGLVILLVVVLRSGSKGTSWLWVAISGAAAVLVPLVIILRAPQRAANQIADLTAGATAGSGRLILWRDALTIAAHHPVLGTGPDSYRLGWYTIRSAASVRLTGLATTSDDPHNLLLLLVATLGIPAALAAIGFIVMTLWKTAGASLGKGVEGGRLLYSGWWAALAATCLAVFFATNTTPVMVALFSATGVLLAARAKNEPWQPWARWSVVAGGTVLAAVALWVSVATISADALMLRAKTTQDGTAYAQQAASTAPWYAKAREMAAVGYANQIVAAMRAGNQGATAEQAAQAEARLNALVASNPAEYKYRVELASYLNNVGPAIGSGAFTRAESAAAAAQAIYPVSAEAAYLKALAQLNLGDSAGAVSTLAPLWNVDPTYPEAGVVYAEALRRTGDTAQAKEIIGQLQKMFPEDQGVAQEASKITSAPAQ